MSHKRIFKRCFECLKHAHQYHEKLLILYYESLMLGHGKFWESNVDVEPQIQKGVLKMHFFSLVFCIGLKNLQSSVLNKPKLKSAVLLSRNYQKSIFLPTLKQSFEDQMIQFFVLFGALLGISAQ